MNDPKEVESLGQRGQRIFAERADAFANKVKEIRATNPTVKLDWSEDVARQPESQPKPDVIIATAPNGAPIYAADDPMQVVHGPEYKRK